MIIPNKECFLSIAAFSIKLSIFPPASSKNSALSHLYKVDRGLLFKRSVQNIIRPVKGEDPFFKICF